MSGFRYLVPVIVLGLTVILTAADNDLPSKPEVVPATALTPTATAFATVDADGDGKLAATDLPALMEEILKTKNRQPPSFMKSKLIKRMTAEADLDHDGSYEVAEIEKFVADLP